MKCVSPKSVALIATEPRILLLLIMIQPTSTPSSQRARHADDQAMRLPDDRSSAPAFSNMITKTNSTMMAPA